ncbi:BamA/TamA family outer membrane protein [Caulobacter soli]|uniref:BamA/TamA family outer membrane protein n=1 Tax=Caulobacter soli TaxID=2708539 RepID=UPI0013EA4FC6|nr:BamA/TamA family outer membrane protein [Caulobacter soli]
MRSLLLCGILVTLPTALRAQDVETSANNLRTPVEQVGTLEPNFVIMPIPMSNPSIGTGLGVAALAIYQPKGSARPWTSGLGGLYTDSKSWGVAAFQKAYLGGDKYRVTAGAGTGVFNVDFFGIGANAGASGRSIELEQKASGGVLEVLARMREHVHAGLRFRYIKMDSTFNTTSLLPQLQLPDIELQSQVSQLGLSGEFDSRDSEYNPRSGVYANGQWMVADDVLGSDFDYSRLTGAVNGYHTVNDKTVLAWRGSICRSGDGAPFYDLCNYGQSNDLRGYTTGQYRDHAMFAVQAEVRRKIYKRFGAVAFAGVGEVSSEFSKMSTKDLLPAAGIGARFEASTKYHVNVSIDYAVGDGTSALYFYVGEAF